MLDGQAVTLWTIRIGTGLYVLAVAGWLCGGGIRLTRAAWTLGCLFFLAHVAAAFHFHHHWSHAEAYRETERQSGELFGIASGAGIYFNYVFTMLWVTDVVWWWLNAEGYRARPCWVGTSIHCFFAFMFVNGAIVFASGLTRWLGLAAMVGIGTLWLARRK